MKSLLFSDTERITRNNYDVQKRIYHEQYQLKFTHIVIY